MSRREVLHVAGLVAAGLAAVPFLSACGAEPSQTRPAGKVATVSVALSRATRRAAGRAARQPGARVVQSFGTDLFRALAREDGNLACSPYSVAVALGMTRNGAVARPPRRWTASCTQPQPPT